MCLLAPVLLLLQVLHVDVWFWDLALSDIEVILRYVLHSPSLDETEEGCGLLVDSEMKSGSVWPCALQWF